MEKLLTESEKVEQPKQNRHKWVRHGHPLHHRKKCVKCGCLKDSKVMNNPVYILSDGSTFFNAPNCPGSTNEYLTASRP